MLPHMSADMSVLGERYAIDIILMAYDKPGMNKTEIIRATPNGERTRAVRVNELVEAGILKVCSGDHWRGMYYELTDMGVGIAEHLAEIRGIFEKGAAGGDPRRHSVFTVCLRARTT